MVLMDSGGDPDLEVRQIATLREHQVNGIVYAAMYHRQLDRLPDALGPVPTVLLDAEIDDPAISCGARRGRRRARRRGRAARPRSPPDRLRHQ